LTKEIYTRAAAGVPHRGIARSWLINPKTVARHMRLPGLAADIIQGGLEQTRFRDASLIRPIYCAG